MPRASDSYERNIMHQIDPYLRQKNTDFWTAYGMSSPYGRVDFLSRQQCFYGFQSRLSPVPFGEFFKNFVQLFQQS